MKALKAYGLGALFGVAFWSLLIGLAMGATVPSTGFFTTANCATIPNPAANSVACLQTTTTGGRTAGKIYTWNGSTYAEIQGSGAPTDATYITQTPNGTLTNEQALNALTAGILKQSSGVVAQATAGSDYVAPGSITTSALTQNTGKLLGRNTASAGAIEEITVGTNLTLSGTTLNASAGAGGYATIQEEGSDLPQRTTLNFAGSAITCADDGGTKTTCTVTGGSSSGLTLVSTQTLVADGADITFSGLDGNADVRYRMVGRLAANGSSNTITFQPNSITTNQTSQIFFSGGAASVGSWLLMSSVATGTFATFSFDFTMSNNPNSVATPRYYIGHNNQEISGTNLTVMIAGKWDETSTNVTSLVIHSDQTNGIKSGAQVSLYKYAQ